MNGTLKHEYRSVFSSYIAGLIIQKKACGYAYDYEAYLLKKFDDFCVINDYTDAAITREIAMEWAIQRDTESANSRNQRVSFLRQLSLYMNSMGVESYIPTQHASSATSVPYIPTADDLKQLFEVIDTYLPKGKRWHSFSMGYQVLFRLFYCCGLRLAEGYFLKREHVDLDNGLLTILESKGHKSRLVHMADDLTTLCRTYDRKISKEVKNRKWFFPGRDASKPLSKHNVDKKFSQLWQMTSCSRFCEKNPTVHALRHAFVVHRMNAWMQDGMSLDAMMPYLSRYLGHSGIKDTMYYYHQVQEAFQIVKEKDHLSGKVIPEVITYEA